MTAADDEGATGSQSVLERIAAVLEVLGWAEGMTLAQISRRTNIPRSSVHRILQQMVDIHWVERVDLKYRLGVGVRELGHRTMAQSRVRRSTVPKMYQVRDATGFNVHFGVLVGGDSINLETIWGSRAVTSFGGSRQPAHATSAGKMLLACRMERGEDLGLPELVPVTKYTITSEQVLVRELQKIRKEEAAIAREECYLNTASVSVPIGPMKNATHALSVSGPADLVRPHEVVRHLRAAASAAWTEATSVVPRRRRPGHLRSTG
ncbi:MAG: IclR family transcriptional regulator [Propionibacterium sp.]|nr:IclR family transcriptional regulator [Propionibacterium sp.]